MKRSFIAALILLTAYLPAIGQLPRSLDAKLRDFERFVVDQMRRDRIPGMTIGFARGKQRWVKGFGYADIENKVPAKPETSYQTASILKGMTAVAVLELADQGLIDLDAEVQTYVPYFPKKKFPITIRQLLYHVGGITHYKEQWEKWIKEPKTTRETVGIFANYDLVAEPGTKFSYSTYGYDLLGAVIEEVAKQPYGTYMQEHVWKPMGMNATQMDDPIAFIPNRAKGYQYFDDGEKNAIFGEIRNAEYIDFSSRFAAGGGRTTVEDMLAFGQAMNEGKLLSPAAQKLTRTTIATRDGHIAGFPGTAGYSMGGMLLQQNGRFCVTYNGGQHGTGTSIFRFPAEDLTIAFAMNIQTRRSFPYFLRLFQILMDEPIWMGAYTGDAVKDSQFAVMQKTFEWGVSSLEMEPDITSDDQKVPTDAVDKFNRLVSPAVITADRSAVTKAVDDGQQPFAGGPLLRLGRHMALQLREAYGAERLRSYHAAGPIVFFADFVKLQKREMRFSSDLETMIGRWGDAWARTNTALVRTTSITPETDIDALYPQLKKLFAGAEIYPDLGLNPPHVDTYGPDFFNATRELVLAGNNERARAFSQAAVGLYPQSDLARAAEFLTTIGSDRMDDATELLRVMEKKAPDGLSSTQSILTRAYEFAWAGRADLGLSMLRALQPLRDQDKDVLEGLGDLARRAGDRQASGTYFKKLLEIDPASKAAREGLSKLGLR